MKKTIFWAAIIPIILYVVLLIPVPQSTPPAPSYYKPFAWNQDDVWVAFEKQFIDRKDIGCESLAPAIDSSFDRCNRLLESISAISINPDDPALARLESEIFNLSVSVAACPRYISSFQPLVISLRDRIKDQSRAWDMSQEAARVATYRMLYGTRAAFEEIILQAEPDSLEELSLCRDEPSATASAEVMGVEIHSGDILVSRGGAPTSALIARGNDFQGNFSHIALVHIDPRSRRVSIIESHIERGATISSLDDYLNDTKLRIMVLRLRRDHQRLQADPLLPHVVAQAALDEATNRHIPYDFAMDSEEPTEKFCSEVVYDPYRRAGVQLWSKISHVSTEGVASWLAAFGVVHFETQAPSDLEYDPQLVVVAEWRDLETLYQDHVDNAVIDAMLEAAERGERLTYNALMLPFARAAKLYSWTLNRFGEIGPVPEGMCAEAALKNSRFSRRHAQIKARTLELAEQFRGARGYRPPYWELLRLARQAKAESDGETAERNIADNGPT
jgi:hypothetical protein